MKKLITFTIVVVVLMLSLGCENGKKPHERLNGTWKSDIMTVTIDFDSGTYEGVALGQIFTKKLRLVSEKANVVTFMSGESKIIAQIADDDSIILTKEGGIPIRLERVD